jgi:hypothetical protein
MELKNNKENNKTYDRIGYNKKYYDKNKEKLLANALVKVLCTYCNKSYSNANLNKHNKSDRHIMKKQIYEIKNKQ